ncbi:MAG: hypothetical protein ACOZIN_17810 [Myxococcota bacterium]
MQTLHSRAARASTLVAVLFALAGCGTSVCDKNAATDLSKKQGTCTGELGGNLLGAKDQCTSAITQCRGSDEAALQKMLDCLGKLPVCAEPEKDAWLASRQGCFEQVAGLSEACRDAVFGGVLPGTDAGLADAGVDAGRQPIIDGGEGLELIAVADETDFALAWSQKQKGVVASWEVHAENDVGLRSLPVSVDAGMTYGEHDAGSGVKKVFFVVGLTAQGNVAFGEAGEDAGVSPDAGGCQGPLDCPVDRVCNLGTCQVQACQVNATCPSGYQCVGATRCVRQFGADGGTADAGSSSGGAAREPLPFISARVEATTGPPAFAPEKFISPFQAKTPDLVAVDSARQFVALEQENQLFGHLTTNRGKSFGSSNIDTLGTRPRLAYAADKGVLYACYNVGLGVRVRRSFDLGRTWGASAADIALPQPADGGTQGRIYDCDIAPWRDGRALMVTVDDEALRVREVSDALQVVNESLAFVSSPADAGNVFAPARPAIVTHPDSFLVHLGFTATRAVTAGADTEVYGAYRDNSTGGTFVSVGRINESGVTTGNPFPQDHVALAIDPTTQRAIAAFTSLESQGAATYSTVYLSLFNPATKRWGTGSDLSVFDQHPVSRVYHVVPDRDLNDAWDAFSPSLAVTPAGRFFLGFLAGPTQVGPSSDYRMYLVEFDLSEKNGLGWFDTVPGSSGTPVPAKRVGTTRVVDPQAGGNAPPPTWTVMAADSQLSLYFTYIEGIGNAAEVENRAVFVSRP